jgi:hypothetical protein
MNPNSGLRSAMSRKTYDTAASAMPPSASAATTSWPHRLDSRSNGTSSPILRTVAPTKFRTNSVPIVGIAE